MPIRCTVTRELVHGIDGRNRPYTMELVHYDDASTGKRLRTRGYIVREASVEVSAAPPVPVVPLQPVANEVAGNHQQFEPVPPRGVIALIREVARSLFWEFF